MNNGTVMRYVTEAVTAPRPDPTRPPYNYPSIGSYFPRTEQMDAALRADGVDR